jgi:hypothetical protein
MVSPANAVSLTRRSESFANRLRALRAEDVAVNVENNVLAIAGEKQQEVAEGDADAEYHLVERRCGRFERSFTLPRTVKADARGGQAAARFYPTMGASRSTPPRFARTMRE